jgi:hypothetical protein
LQKLKSFSFSAPKTKKHRALFLKGTISRNGLDFCLFVYNR